MKGSGESLISKTIDVAGLSLHYADFGGQGPTMVLVHGLGGSHANWIGVGPELARRGRVLALDLPGFGRSPRSPAGTSLEVMGEALSGFIDAVSKDPVHLVSNSMGSALCVLEGHARPDRIASSLLVGPALPPPLGAHVDPRWMTTMLIASAPGGHVLLRRRAAKAGPEQQIREIMSLCCVDPSRVHPDLIGAHVAMAIERAPLPWVERAFGEASRSLLGHMTLGRRLRRALRQPGPPTLIVHGQRDRLVDVRGSRVVVAANPRIELTELPDLGHTPQIEAPAVFMEVATRWLDRVAAEPARARAGE
jgi:pimeloyl-ACP methyl ester carboxylesterase